MTSQTSTEGTNNTHRTIYEPIPMDSMTSGMLMAIIAIGSVAIFSNSRSLTPDFVDRVNADRWGILLTLGSILAGVVLLLGSGAAILRRKNATGNVLMLAGVFAMVWWAACVIPSDYEGKYNPYVRRMEPLESQSEQLLEAKSLPPVANQIRQAASDGRIDRGEAHDILNSRSYFDARAVEYQGRQAETRRKLLTE